MKDDIDRLILKAQQNDIESFNEIFKRIEKRLYLFIVKTIKDEDSSLDILQETFLSIFKNLKYLRINAKFKPWTYKIAYNKCQDYFRKRKQANKWISEKEVVDYGVTETPLDVMIAKERVAEFNGVLNNLWSGHRSVVTLFFVEKLKVAEIARILDIPEGTVKSRIHYTTQKIREFLKGGTK